MRNFQMLKHLNFGALVLLISALFASSNFVNSARGQPNGTSVQECEWLEKYVKDSSMNGVFPLGPAEVTWSVSSAPSIPDAQKETHRKFVEKVIHRLPLPHAYSGDSENAQVLFFSIPRKKPLRTLREYCLNFVAHHVSELVFLKGCHTTIL